MRIARLRVNVRTITTASIVANVLMALIYVSAIKTVLRTEKLSRSVYDEVILVCASR